MKLNNQITNALEDGELILFIGAGASFNSRTSFGHRIPLGNELAKQLCEDLGTPYKNEPLKTVYQAYKNRKGMDRLQKMLEKIFKNCRHSDEYTQLSKLPLKRIYSLNIDDCVENGFNRNRKRIDVKSREDSINEYSFDNEVCTLIKLNGDINNPKSKYIFSTSDYASNIISESNWYKELAKDMHNYTFIFIGTKLDEPLLAYHLELFKNENNISSASKSYLITPDASEIEIESLSEFNIEYLKGTFEEFIKSIFKKYDNSIPTYAQVAKKLFPYSITDNEDISLLSKITPINSQNLHKSYDNKPKISKFYQGFKPTWQDIVDGIPAKLEKTELFFKEKLTNSLQKNTVFTIIGNAGSGKSTALKQIAYEISNLGNEQVYFLENDYDNLSGTLKYLDKINEKPFFICIDRVLNNRYHEIVELIDEGKTQASFVITENIALWENKAKSVFQDKVKLFTLNLSTIESRDAKNILDKIKTYGNWTRLSKLSESERRKELISKAKKQLLIGLLEVTSGFGYEEIIQKDFNAIESEDGKNLLILTSIPALENLPANYLTIERALRELNPTFSSSLKSLEQDTVGTLTFNNKKILTRHRVYSQKIFDKNLENSTILPYVKAYISAFTGYQFPIVKNISNNEASVYKQLVNFKFLKKLFKEDKHSILDIYETFEKTLEQEGLFFLQYGLALRHFKIPFEAYQKLIFASHAYPDSPQIEHALAQQKLILSASSEEYGINREKLFDEARATLLRLSNIEIGSFRNDRYPIVTLSRGHINYIAVTEGTEQAKIIAMDYFNQIQKFPEHKTDNYLSTISEELMLFFHYGYWKNNISDWNF